MDRLFRLLDTVLGLTFAAALAFGVLSALPNTAHAADNWTTGIGPATAEQRNVGEFQAIAVSGSIKLKVRQGGKEAVEVRAEANLLPLLETVVESSSSGKTLYIRWKKGSNLRIQRSPTVEVSVVQLQSLSTSGSSDIAVEPLKTPQLAVSIAGAGDVGLQQLTGDELSVKIAGSGDFKASGQVSKLKISVSGSGDVQTDGLKADDVSINIAGSGDAAVHAAKSLSVSIAGSGDVAYRGDAQVKSSIVGSGSVHRR
ncbi:head GIN domain-containing protein [Aquabacterium sp.]|uniref:head GIN domain-containing protein n=1 Tax=Aquabacterium sp. TaxID=1872578 RepID=UPI002BC31BF4|nr:head GIN domain-containing protein [Aquabacterium sp.]HSW03671.1 head GIN domain-containing protein [Aquabacterium sp.]